MTKARIELGKYGESLALKKIEGLGYQCICRNYRCSLGEIDLIAKDGDTLVFLEIKTRKGKSLGYAKEAVDRRKIRKLSKIALAYMKEMNWSHAKSRFDVIAINIHQGHPEIELIKNAFDQAYDV